MIVMVSILSLNMCTKKLKTFTFGIEVRIPFSVSWGQKILLFFGSDRRFGEKRQSHLVRRGG